MDSPVAVIEKVAQLAKPGGLVILEFTDSFHLWSIPVVLYQNLLKLIKPPPYRLNRLKKWHRSFCKQNGLRIGIYRYGLHPPGPKRLSVKKKCIA